MKKQKIKPDFNKSRLRSAIRKEWMWSELRKKALSRAREARGIYRCEKCSKLVGPKEIEVNHIVKATPDQGLNTGNDWGIFIDRLLYCGIEGLETLCTQCHEVVSQKEREEVQQRKCKVKKKKT